MTYELIQHNCSYVEFLITVIAVVTMPRLGVSVPFDESGRILSLV